MNPDIVERLRNPLMVAETTSLGAGGMGRAVMVEDVARKDMIEAADLIEHLRAMIDQFRLRAGPVSIESCLTFSDIKKNLKTNG